LGKYVSNDLFFLQFFLTNNHADETAVFGMPASSHSSHSKKLNGNNSNQVLLSMVQVLASADNSKRKHIKVGVIGIFNIQASYPAAIFATDSNRKTTVTLIFAAGYEESDDVQEERRFHNSD
jgi:hypothetical protein